jgi:hypothetical protein
MKNKMKTLLTILLITSVCSGEERAMSKKKEAILCRFNRQYDSLFVMKKFHGADSLQAVARMRHSMKLLK